MIIYLLCQPENDDLTGEHRVTVAFAELQVARRYFDTLPPAVQMHAHLEPHQIGTSVLLHERELLPA